jgi:hypothetical protein
MASENPNDDRLCLSVANYKIFFQLAAIDPLVLSISLLQFCLEQLTNPLTFAVFPFLCSSTLNQELEAI